MGWVSSLNQNTKHALSMWYKKNLLVKDRPNFAHSIQTKQCIFSYASLTSQRILVIVSSPRLNNRGHIRPQPWSPRRLCSKAHCGPCEYQSRTTRPRQRTSKPHQKHAKRPSTPPAWLPYSPAAEGAHAWPRRPPSTASSQTA